jgi:hypothetical protein
MNGNEIMRRRIESRGYRPSLSSTTTRPKQAESHEASRHGVDCAAKPSQSGLKERGQPHKLAWETDLFICRILEEVKYDHHTYYLSSKAGTRQTRLYSLQSHDVHYSYLWHVSTLKRAVPVSRLVLVSWKMGTGSLVVPRRRDVESYGLKIWV